MALIDELETLARLMRQLPEVEKDAERCQEAAKNALDNVAYVKEGIEEIRQRVCDLLMPPNIVVDGPQAPSQAAPSPELLPVTPGAEEKTGGPIIDAQTCEPIDPHVSWEPPPPVEAEPDPIVDVGGYAPVTAEDFDTITIVEDPELTQEVIDALMEPVSVLDDPELQAAVGRAQATLVDAELEAELDRVREQERARAKHHFSIFGKLEDA